MIRWRKRLFQLLSFSFLLWFHSKKTRLNWMQWKFVLRALGKMDKITYIYSIFLFTFIPHAVYTLYDIYLNMIFFDIFFFLRFPFFFSLELWEKLVTQFRILFTYFFFPRLDVLFWSLQETSTEMWCSLLWYERDNCQSSKLIITTPSKCTK